MTKCIHFGCDGSTSTTSHRLPRNDELRKLWLRAINREDLIDKSYTEVHLYTVCGTHFATWQYRTAECKKLNLNSVPNAKRDSADASSSKKPSPCSEFLSRPCNESSPNKCDDKLLKETAKSYAKPGSSQENLCKEDLSSILPKIMESDIPDSITLRKLGLTRIKSLTPREQELYKSQKKAKHLLRVMKAHRKNKSKKTSHVPQKRSLRQFNNLPRALQIFVQCQLRKFNVKKVYKYTKEENALFISIYRHSPRCYKYLQTILPFLPSIKTLQRAQKNIKFSTGISKNLFSYLNKISKAKDGLDKYCVVMWDEMALRPGLYWNRSKDFVEGFEDFGSEKRFVIADHVLVFMIRGLCKKWKQPVAYYFAQSATKTYSLKSCISEVIRAIHKMTEFRVLASVCDMGPSNRPAIESLSTDNHRSGEFVYNIDGHEIIHLFDVPHLLKCLRNNFMTKDIIYENTIAKWDHIKVLSRLSSFESEGKIGKLTKDHVYPEVKKIMKVKLAAQVFSKTVFSLLKLLDNHAAHLGKQKQYGGTTEFVCFVNDLFDSLNSVHKSSKPLASRLDSKSMHHSFWAEAKTKLNNLKFVKNGKVVTRPPCVLGFIVTIRNVQSLWSRLKDLDFQYLSTRCLNQDPLENFFSVVRGLGGLNPNPTCSQFKSAYSTAIVSNSVRNNQGSNCEEDGTDLLLNLEFMLTLSEEAISSSTTVIPLPFTSDFPTSDIPTSSSVPSTSTSTFTNPALPSKKITLINDNLSDEKIKRILQVNNSAYLSGAILRTILKNTKCKICTSYLLTKNITDKHAFIELKDYGVKKNLLLYPSEEFISFIHTVRFKIFRLFPTFLHYNNILSTILEQVELSIPIPCPAHSNHINSETKYILTKILLYTFLSLINKKINLKVIKTPNIINDYLNISYQPLKAKLKNYFEKKEKRK